MMHFLSNNWLALVLLACIIAPALRIPRWWRNR